LLPQHETNLLLKLSRNASNQLKAVFIYEMFDEPHQGNAYPQTCATGNTSWNGESCYRLVGTSWPPGPRCDQYPSCTFSATKRKPAFAMVQQLARQLSTPPPAPPVQAPAEVDRVTSEVRAALAADPIPKVSAKLPKL
jgi:hypothetical protein